MGPKKLTPEAKKKALDDALNWLRGNDVTLNDVDEPTLNALLKAAGMSMPKAGLLPEEEKEKAIEESLEWLRNNDLDMDDVDGPTVKTLSKLASTSLPLNISPENKEKTVDSAVEWLRNADAEDLQPIDNPDLERLTRLAGVPMPGISDIDKARALKEALEWLRNN